MEQLINSIQARCIKAISVVLVLPFLLLALDGFGQMNQDHCVRGLILGGVHRLTAEKVKISFCPNFLKIRSIYADRRGIKDPILSKVSVTCQYMYLRVKS